MKSSTKKLTRIIASSVLCAGAIGMTTQVIAKSNCPVEKCYGIVKKAKNDCGTSKHACAAQAKQSGGKDEWMFVMKGNCDRIVGGSLTPPAGDKK